MNSCSNTSADFVDGSTGPLAAKLLIASGEDRRPSNNHTSASHLRWRPPELSQTQKNLREITHECSRRGRVSTGELYDLRSTCTEKAIILTCDGHVRGLRTLVFPFETRMVTLGRKKTSFDRC